MKKVLLLSVLSLLLTSCVVETAAPDCECKLTFKLIDDGGVNFREVTIPEECTRIDRSDIDAEKEIISDSYVDETVIFDGYERETVNCL